MDQSRVCPLRLLGTVISVMTGRDEEYETRKLIAFSFHNMICVLVFVEQHIVACAHVVRRQNRYMQQSMNNVHVLTILVGQLNSG